MNRYDRKMPQYQTEDAGGAIVGIALFLIVLKVTFGIDIPFLDWL